MYASVRTAAKKTWRALGTATSPLRILPDFLIIGTQKGGTTSLFNYLIQHPCVARPMMKEVHYFDAYWERGLPWYRALFPLSAVRAAASRVRGTPVLTGEATPSYMAHPRAAERAAAIVPDARLIVMLREPVDRTYSHWRHRVRRGVEHLDFQAAVETEEALLARERENLASASPEERTEHEMREYRAYLHRGAYVDQLRAWEEHFPRDRFLVVFSEDFFADPGSVFRRAVEHLGLPAWEPREYRRLNDGGERPPLDPVFAQRLRDHFDPLNERLARHLGQDLPWRA